MFLPPPSAFVPVLTGSVMSGPEALALFSGKTLCAWQWKDSCGASGPKALWRHSRGSSRRKLARAYPDFCHESPHNILLDLLTSEGAGGLLALAAIAAIGIYAGGPPYLL